MKKENANVCGRTDKTVAGFVFERFSMSFTARDTDKHV